MVELTFVRDLVAIIGVIAGFTYYFITVRNQKRSRQAQLFMQMYDKLSNEMRGTHLRFRRDWKWTDFEDFMEFVDSEKYPENHEDWLKLLYYWESIGVLVKRGYIDVNLVDDLMSGLVLTVWDKLEPVVMEIRERYRYPQFQEFHEYLAKEVKRIVDEQHPNFEGGSLYKLQ